jgi:electron transfer flavoprotein beta subunit
VLHGRSVVADHLGMLSLTQVIKLEVVGGALHCERQAEYGYDTVEVELPAVIAVGEDANAPIFEFSDLGIVGDLNNILPKLTAALRMRKAG